MPLLARDTLGPLLTPESIASIVPALVEGTKNTTSTTIVHGQQTSIQTVPSPLAYLAAAIMCPLT
ncbi:hypothetical protein XPA_000049 [Xanthoria parietina]